METMIETPTGILQMLLDAVKSGQWLLVGSLGLVVLVWALRQFGGKWMPFLKTDRGGALLAVASGLCTYTATALISGAAFSLQMLLAGLEMGVTAAGGYAILKKLFFPSDQKSGG